MYDDHNNNGGERERGRDGGRGGRGHHSHGGGHGGHGGHGGGGGRGRRGGDPDREGRGVPLSDLDPALTEVSRKLIGCAIEVHKGLGPGFEREVYLKALEIELTAQSVQFSANHEYPVYYRGKQVGARKAHLLIEQRFVVDLYAHRGEIGSAERGAMRALLKAADLELGLIVNFAERRLKDGLVRVLNPDKLSIKDPDAHADDQDHGHADDSNDAHA